MFNKFINFFDKSIHQHYTNYQSTNINNRDKGFYFYLYKENLFKNINIIHIPKCGGTSFYYHIKNIKNIFPAPVSNNEPHFQLCCERLQKSNIINKNFKNQYENILKNHKKLFNNKKNKYYLYPVEQITLNDYFKISTFKELYKNLFITIRNPSEMIFSLVKFRIKQIIEEPDRESSKFALKCYRLNINEFKKKIHYDPEEIIDIILNNENLSLLNFLFYNGLNISDNKFVYTLIHKILELKCILLEPQYTSTLLGKYYNKKLKPIHVNSTSNYQHVNLEIFKDKINQFVNHHDKFLYEFLNDNIFLKINKLSCIEEYFSLLDKKKHEVLKKIY